MHARTSGLERARHVGLLSSSTRPPSTAERGPPIATAKEARPKPSSSSSSSRHEGMAVGGLRIWRRYVWPWASVALGADKRSVALFRVVLALTVLGDVVDRAHDLRAHYTDAGVLPRSAAIDTFGNRTWVSVHMWGGSWWLQAALFALHAAAALAMLVGWRARRATFVVWLMTTSLHVRNVLVLHSGDVLLRCSLLWALFLPLGEVASIDAALASPSSEKAARRSSLARLLADRFLPTSAHDEAYDTGSDDEVATQRMNETDRKEASDHRRHERLDADGGRYSCINAGTLAVLMQVSIMYFTSVYHKTGDDWVDTGNATYFALQLDYFRMPMADLMIKTLHPHLLPLFTFAVLYWEWLGSFCFIFPIKTGFMRTFAVLAYMFMHLGFAVCMRLATFFWAAEAALVVLLPGWFWDEFLFKYILRKSIERTRFELFYTEKSLFTFYEHLAKVMSVFFLFPETEVKPLCQLQNDPLDGEEAAQAQDRPLFTELADACLVAVDYKGQVHQDFQAIVMLCNASPVLWPMGWLLTQIAHSPALSRCFLCFGFLINVAAEGFMHFLLGEQFEHYRKGKDKTDAPLNHGPHSTFERYVGRRNIYRRKPKLKFRYLFTAKSLARIGRNLVGLYLVYFVFGWTMNDIGIKAFVPSYKIRWLAYTVHIDQAWNMFSPGPPHESWWYIIEATTLSDDVIELHRNRGMFEWKGNPLDGKPGQILCSHWEPPDSLPDTIGNHRWFKFYEQLNNHKDHSVIRQQFGRYICREWNKRHSAPDRVYEFRLWWLSNRVHLDGSRTEQPKQLLWHHLCYEKKPGKPAGGKSANEDGKKETAQARDSLAATPSAEA